MCVVKFGRHLHPVWGSQWGSVTADHGSSAAWIWLCACRNALFDGSGSVCVQQWEFFAGFWIKSDLWSPAWRESNKEMV